MKLFIKMLTMAVWFGAQNMQAQQQTLPYQNPLLPAETRAEDLLSRMTLEEKIAQIRHLHSWDVFDGQQLNKQKLEKFCSGIGFGFFEGFPLTAANCQKTFREIQTYLVEKTRLGIPGFPVAESLHGVVHEGATIYPQNIALGSTFNPSLAYEKTKHISGELNTMGVKQVLAPCIDVVRELRWGRVEESFSEDPFLCSQMAVAEVKGYMDHGISPMLKHYGPHGNPTGGLNLASVECGVRDLFDIYLKPFEAVCTQTNIMAVMSSYNSWNRMPNSASHFMLTDILRNKFGFRGYVYSDWGAIDMLKTFHYTAGNEFEAAKQALEAGLDVEASSSCFPALIEHIRKGTFDIRHVNQAVKRVLVAKFELGLFEDPYLEKTAYRLPLRASESVRLSRRIAEESIILLKNEHQLLPLNPSTLKSVAVIGPNADKVQFGDYTWSKKKEDGVTPLQSIRQSLKGKAKVHYAQGCSLASLDTTGIAEAVETVRKSDVALVFVGSSSTAFVRHSREPSTSGEGIDLNDISLTGAQETLIKRVYDTGKPVVVILVAGKPFAIPWIKEHIPAVVAQWYGGEQEGNAIADVLFGRVNPSGKLSFSFPQSTGHLPAYYNYLPTDKGFYKEPGTYEKPGRDYVFSDPAALWSFGHGLSYTSFQYVSAMTDKKLYQPFDTIKVDVSVKNTGHVRGKEVVQVYVRDLVSSIVTPIKQLKGFSKIDIAPGETANTIIKVPVTELYLTDNMGQRTLEPGTFEIQIGTSSAHIYYTLPITVGMVSSQNQNSVIKATVDTKCASVSDKEVVVEGSVRDVQATPVNGCQVKCLLTGVRVLTDSMGKYKIKVAGNSTLLFSKKGYTDKKVPIRQQTSINIQLTK